jgi:Flp pilus assembly protein TadB
MSMQRDLICSLILLGVAALYYALARELGQTALSDAVGPAGLPLVYAAALAAFAVLLSVSAYLRRGRRATTTAADEPGPGRRLKRALGALAIGGVYIAVVPLIGYPPAMALAIAAMAAYQGERLGWRLALIAVAGAGALFVLFELVLGVPMPAPWNA